MAFLAVKLGSMSAIRVTVPLQPLLNWKRYELKEPSFFCSFLAHRSGGSISEFRQHLGDIHQRWHV